MGRFYCSFALSFVSVEIVRTPLLIEQGELLAAKFADIVIRNQQFPAGSCRGLFVVIHPILQFPLEAAVILKHLPYLRAVVIGDEPFVSAGLHHACESLMVELKMQLSAPPIETGLGRRVVRRVKKQKDVLTWRAHHFLVITVCDMHAQQYCLSLL